MNERRKSFIYIRARRRSESEKRRFEGEKRRSERLGSKDYREGKGVRGFSKKNTSRNSERVSERERKKRDGAPARIRPSGLFAAWAIITKCCCARARARRKKRRGATWVRGLACAREPAPELRGPSFTGTGPRKSPAAATRKIGGTDKTKIYFSVASALSSSRINNFVYPPTHHLSIFADE